MIEVLEAVAQIKGVSEAELAIAAYKNTNQVFKLL
jgi:hypothetical protein